MRSTDLEGVRRGKRFVTTKSDPTVPRAPDLVQRDFTATEPNRLWVVDYTYVPAWSGMAFTAFVTDVFTSHRGLADRSVDADFAAARRPGDGVVDPRAAGPHRRWSARRVGASLRCRAAQYVSIRYSERLADAGAVASIGSVGDNSQIESLIGLYKLVCARARASPARVRRTSSSPP